MKQNPIPLLLKHHRQIAGFTQKQATKELDISERYLSMCERGQRVPSPEMLTKLATLYGCDVEEFYDVRFPEIMALARYRAREYLLDENVDVDKRARMIVTFLNSHRNDEGIAQQTEPAWTSVSDLIHIFGEPNPDRMRIPMRDDLVPITQESSETKKAFFLSTDEVLVQSGPRDCSKTYDALLFQLWLCENCPGIQIGVSRPEKSGIGATLWKSLKLMLKFPYAKDPRNPFIIVGGLHHPDKIVFENEAEIEFFGLYAEGQQRGKQKHVVFLNQGELEKTRENYASLIAAMTGERAGPIEKPDNCPWEWRIFIDCNPDLPLHWLYKAMENKELTWFDYKHSDHPHLWDHYKKEYTPKGVKVREDIKRAYPPGHERDRMLDGIWCMAQGAVLNCFDPAKHLLPPEKQPEIQKDWTHYRALDFGVGDPFVCLWISTDPETEKSYVWQEYSQTGKRDAEHAEFMNLHSRQLEYLTTWADSEDLNARLNLAELDIPTQITKKDIKARIRILNRLFAEDKLYIFEGLKKNNDPQFQNRNLPHDLPAEIAQLRFTEKKTGAKSDDLPDKSCSDHRFDALGYWAEGVYGMTEGGVYIPMGAVH